MAKDLGQVAEKDMIPLVFKDALFDGKLRFTRTDTEEVLTNQVKILQPDTTVSIIYSGKGTIRMKPQLKEANGLLFPENPEQGKLYPCNYCEVE